MLVNKDLTSNDINLLPSANKLSGMFLILLTASKLSCRLYSLCVTGLSRRDKNLATGW